MSDTTTEGAIVVIGIAGFAHMHVLDTVRAFVTAKTTGAAYVAPKNAVSGATFGKWIGGVIGLSMILLIGSSSKSFGEVFDTLAVLIAGTSVVLYLDDITAMFGAGPGSNYPTTSVPAPGGGAYGPGTPGGSGIGNSTQPW
jgi:hypothetical protein